MPSTASMQSASPAIVITGASSGIGREIARVAARERTHLLLVARSHDALAELCGELDEAACLALDLRDRGAGDAIAAALRQRNWYCDVLVHGAGLGLMGLASELDSEQQVVVLDVNARVLTELVLRFLPGMVARRRGGVLAVGSVAGYFPGPNMAVYYASKAYVRSFADALHAETKGAGVTVTCVSPGFVSTAFLTRSGLRRTRLRRIMPRLTAAEVAEAGWRGFRSRRRIVIPGITNRIVIGLSRVVPTRFALWLIGRLQR